MAHNEDVFTITENDNMKEIFSVAEEVIPLPEEEGEQLTPPAQGFNRQPDTSSEQKADVPQGWRGSKNPAEFMTFLQQELNRIGNPRQWRTKSEKERGLAQLKKLDHFTSEALRTDYDNVLDVAAVDSVRTRVEHYIDEVETALEGIQNMKKQRKHMRRRGEEDHEITKEAATPRLSVVISPFERAIVGALMNGRAAGGRDIEELYADVKKKYDISEREELSIFQILADMGFPTFKDRLRIGENEDPTRENGLGEWSSQYYA